jgi:hypothetical protein
METQQTCYNWHVKIDETLRGKTKIAAMEHDVEVRKYISDVLKKELKKEGKL